MTKFGQWQRSKQTHDSQAANENARERERGRERGREGERERERENFITQGFKKQLWLKCREREFLYI